MNPVESPPSPSGLGRGRDVAAWVSFGVVLVAGLVFRLAVIDEPFWVDEAVSALRYFSVSPDQIVTIEHPNNHPLYSLVVWSLWSLGPDNEILARLPSLMAWLAMLGLLVWLGNGAFAKPIGWLAAVLAVVAFWPIRYSIEARGNMLATTLGLVAIGLLLVGLERRSSLLTVGSGGVLAVAAFAHLYAAVLAVGVPLIWIAARIRSVADLRAETRPMVGWAAAFGGGLVLLYLPSRNLVRLAASLVLRGEVSGSLALTPSQTMDGDYLLDLAAGLLSGSDSLAGVAALVVPFAIGAWSVRRDPTALAIIGVAPAVILAAVATGFVFYERFFLVIAPYALFGVAAGVWFAATALLGRWPAVSVVAAAVMAVALALGPAGGFPETLPPQVRPWDEAVGYIEQEGGSLVIANPVLEGWSEVRDSLRFYLDEAVLVEPKETGLNAGTEVFYVRTRGGVPEPGLRVVAEDGVRFGEIEVFRLVWHGDRLEPREEPPESG